MDFDVDGERFIQTIRLLVRSASDGRPVAGASD